MKNASLSPCHFAKREPPLSSLIPSIPTQRARHRSTVASDRKNLCNKTENQPSLTGWNTVNSHPNKGRTVILTFSFSSESHRLLYNPILHTPTKLLWLLRPSQPSRECECGLGRFCLGRQWPRGRVSHLAFGKPLPLDRVTRLSGDVSKVKDFVFIRYPD